MASRPTTIPQLDTNKTNRVAPVAGKVTDGYVLNDLFPSSNANYLHGWAGDWHEWLQERSEDGTTPGTDLTLRGLDALIVTGDGGVLTLKGGDGGTTSGDGGNIVLLPGDVVSGTRGGVGIDTITVPHGGIGYAKVAIEGTDSSANGPHTQFTTSADDYPLFQQLNWSHDNVSFFFDCYFDGSDVRSSDAGSNFAIQKLGDSFQIRYDSGIAAGSVVTLSPGIALDISGNVGIGVPGAIDTLLHLYGTAPLITFEDTVGDKYLTGNSDGNFLIYNVTDTRNDLTITGTGNVGINEISPLGRLHVKTADVGVISPSANADELILENSGSCGMTIYSGNTAGGYVYFGDVDADSTGGMYYSHSATTDRMFLLVAGGNAICIDASQNVGVYEPDPLAKLHVKTADAGSMTVSADADELCLEGSGNTGMTIVAGATSNVNIHLGDAADPDQAWIQYDCNDLEMIIGVNTKSIMWLEGGTTYARGGIGDFTTAPNATFEVRTHSSVTEEAMRITQNAATYPLVFFGGTSGASTSATISTLTTPGALQGFLQCTIGGAKRWIPFYADPS